MHGPHKVPEPFSVDDRGRLNVHYKIVQHRSHYSNLEKVKISIEKSEKSER